ncbi:unnamed protein product, partial [Iphiclides podalirius]
MLVLKDLLLLALLASAEISEFDDSGDRGEVCYVCSCSVDRTSVDCSKRGLTSVPDGISEMVANLNVSYNEISTFPQNLNRLYNLLTLDLSGNRLSSIPENALENLTALEILNLSRNNFDTWLNLNPNETWLEACYFTWNPSKKAANPDSLIWFVVVMIVGLALCLVLVNGIRRSMNRRLATLQNERVRQVEEARDRLRQLRMRAEQEALCNAPDPRDLVAPPSYDEALSMPKLNASCQSLCEEGTGKRKRRKGRRKTKSSGDLLEETERNGDLPVVDDVDVTDTSDNNRRRRRRRPRKYGSHEIAELDQSPGVRRRRMSEYGASGNDSVTIEVEAQMERPLRPRNRRYSIDDDEPRESDF